MNKIIIQNAKGKYLFITKPKSTIIFFDAHNILFLISTIVNELKKNRFKYSRIINKLHYCISYLLIYLKLCI